MSLGTSLSYPIQRIEAELTQDQVESTTGEYADLGLQLGEQSGYELSLRNQNDLLTSLTNANSIISINLTSTQDALTSINQSAQTTLQQLIGQNTSANSPSVLQTLGVAALQQLTSTLNQASNGQYLFAGQNTGVAPISNYFASPTSAAQTAVDQAFQSSFGVSADSAGASTITESALQTFLDGPFANLFQGSSWQANFSSASDTNSTSEIAPGQTVETTTSSNQPAIQHLMQAYVLIAAFANSSLSSSAQQVVVSTASSLISEGVSELATTQANIGTTQAQIADANSAMASQQTILQTQIGSLDNVNAQQVATNLNTLSTQLQAAYELTAQLQKLSLAQYLPVA